MDEKKINDGWRPVLFYGKKNVNGRTYTKDSFTKATMDDMDERIKNHKFFGELGHPVPNLPNENEELPTYLSEGSVVSLSRISHSIEEVKNLDNIMFVKVKMLDTPNGETLKLFPEGSVVFRPRSIGTVNPDGTVDVREVISFDAIPAADDSFRDMQIIYDDMLKNKNDMGTGRVDLEDIDKAFFNMPDLPDLPDQSE